MLVNTPDAPAKMIGKYVSFASAHTFGSIIVNNMSRLEQKNAAL